MTDAEDEYRIVVKMQGGQDVELNTTLEDGIFSANNCRLVISCLKPHFPR